MEIAFDSIIENYNSKNEFLIKIWIWIAIISVFGLLVSSNPDLLESINFPGIDIPVPVDYFLPVYLIVLTGMILKWVDVFHRSVLLRQNVIEVIFQNKDVLKIEEADINTRDLIDGIVYPTTTSTWGIVPNFKDNKKLSSKRKRLITYILTKIVIFVAHFVLPILAYIIPLINLDYSEKSLLFIILVYFISIIGFLAITKTICTEWNCVSIAIERHILCNSEKKSDVKKEKSMC